MKNDVNEYIINKLYEMIDELEYNIKYNMELNIEYSVLWEDATKQLIYETAVHIACITEIQKLISQYKSKE
jgi:hypothetical protein